MTEQNTTPENTELQIEAPQAEAAPTLQQIILGNLPEGLVLNIIEKFGQLIVTTSLENITKLVFFLRDNEQCKFQQLVDITAVDYPDHENRFEMVYQLLSLKHNNRITVKFEINDEAIVPSICEIFSNANWLEREVWDMYGVRFKNHPDLRRILTDYGFEGHPQRKDFPLTGFLEVRYDEAKAKVVYEPVKLHQEYRSFDYLSPWEGSPNYVLPGDEKAKAS
jgi:NADH-quinone oxidoreductase subunit C